MDNLSYITKQIIRSLLNNENFDPDDNDTLTNHGIDILKMICILVEVEEQFQITFEDHDLINAEWNTINEIVTLLKTNYRGKGTIGTLNI